MTDAASLSGLSFFTVNRFSHTDYHVCDFCDNPCPHYCMGLILEGEGTFEFEDNADTVGRGDIIFLPVGCRYRSVWRGSPDVVYISMHFFFLSHTPFGADKYLPIQKVSPFYEGKFFGAFTEALRCFSAETAGQFSALGCFYHVLGAVFPRLSCSQRREYDQRLDRAAEYLEKHCTEKIKIEKLAALCYMSQSYFHVRFKSAFGMTPISYKNRVCIRRAVMLLLRGEDSVGQISESLGYESTTYFRRVFRKVTGCAPTEYVEKHRGI